MTLANANRTGPEADLVHAKKEGKSVIYHLKLSVLEEALLGFVNSVRVGVNTPKSRTRREITPSTER